MIKTNNLRVEAFEGILTPEEAMKKVPVTEKARETVIRGRADIEAILDGNDSRKIVVVGPCSIHDKEQALEYAEKLAELAAKVSDKMVLVMRTYFEKPRTTVGWKGYVYDPGLDGLYGLQDGVVAAREILVAVNEMGLPTATEVLGPVVVQYYSDLICWSAIGARTAESQTHRELASGMSMPVGFKNGTEGNVDIAVNAILSARSPHGFLGMNDHGEVAVVKTKGNPYGHVILRGGKNGPNYSEADVGAACAECLAQGVTPRIVVDCSHANSEKDFRKQGEVWKEVWRQIGDGGVGGGVGGGGVGGGEVGGGEVGDRGDGEVGGEAGRAAGGAIVGLMLESNLKEGAQKIGGGFGELEYGVSVTDSCIGWEETEKLILEAYEG